VEANSLINSLMIAFQGATVLRKDTFTLKRPYSIFAERLCNLINSFRGSGIFTVLEVFVLVSCTRLSQYRIASSILLNSQVIKRTNVTSSNNKI
jgi:hypothetical protein